VNAQYKLFNKPVTQEQFEQFIQKLRQATRQEWSEYYQRYNDLIKESFTRYYQGAHNENSTGNYLYHSKNCLDTFLVTEGEQLRYCAHLVRTKDAMDYNYWGDGAELIYEVLGAGNNVSNIKFCNLCWSGCSSLEYCDHCFATQDSFGCVGLKSKRYCILNKQYSQTEYDRLLLKIKAYMRSTGEYGEFFPIECSPYAYNETLAGEFFLLSEAQVMAADWSWQLADERDYQPQQYRIPEQISQVDNTIIKEILACESCGKNYRIISQELTFYRQEYLSLPSLCSVCRHNQRLQKRPGYSLWQRQCMCTQPIHQHQGRCVQEFSTAYSPETLEMIYCEQCYQKEIY
jgi:hypothetical protein